eukprot:g5451.t1
MAEGTACRLPLASLPDGALAHVLSFGEVPDLVVVNNVCRAWVLEGNRAELWTSLGKHFEVTMPVSLGPLGRTRGGGALRQKRALRSAANAKRTFLKSWSAAVKMDRIKHDTTLSEAYTLFRMQDSVVRLRTLLRRRWGITFQAPSTTGGFGDTNTYVGKIETAADGGGAREVWRGSGRWAFNVNHRHGIYEGNTILNFAVRCGRKKCVEFILWRMGADTEIPDYGGFTPLINTAWRGDLPLLKQLLAAGAKLDVQGVSRGVGPHSPLEWAERKNRPVTAAFLRSIAEKEKGGGGASGSHKVNAKAEKGSSQTDVRVGAP